ncbi:MAG: CARDB domain-containing protein [archaeon]
MGLYDSGIYAKFGEEKKKIAMGVLAAVVIAVAIWSILVLAPISFDDHPIKYRFEKNPIRPGEQAKVTITISNNGKMDAQNVKLFLQPKEKTEFDIFPVNEKFRDTIPLISAGTSREVTFLINPVGEVLPGTYTLVATAQMNGKIFTESATLTVSG